MDVFFGVWAACAIIGGVSIGAMAAVNDGFEAGLLGFVLGAGIGAVWGFVPTAVVTVIVLLARIAS